METIKHDVRIVFQQSNGLFPIDNKELTESEFQKLITLMETTRWIIVKYPQDYRKENILCTHPDSVNVSKLSNETLYKIRDGKPLGEEGFQDVLNSIE